MKVSQKECELYERDGLRPRGYVAELLRVADSASGGVINLSDDTYAAIRAKYAGMPKRPPQTIPADFDPAREARRMKHGGCCGQASDGNAT